MASCDGKGDLKNRLDYSNSSENNECWPKPICRGLKTQKRRLDQKNRIKIAKGKGLDEKCLR